jgi:hypothetical protein
MFGTVPVESPLLDGDSIIQIEVESEDCLVFTSEILLKDLINGDTGVPEAFESFRCTYKAKGSTCNVTASSCAAARAGFMACRCVEEPSSCAYA